ncbi:MAG: hypothetical protein RBS56_00990 [Candidatus Gracilibacteria bacterium]|jgi:5'-nucleotidase|nr:hypothetical protein [Candidatus Gracilibacteria bacterium]
MLSQIQEFLSHTPEKLQVLTDFDGTLTEELKDGKPAQSIISVLRNTLGYLDEDYQKKAHELYEKYHSLEYDTALTLEERKAKMHEWWQSHKKLLIAHGLNLKDIESVAKSGHIKLRKSAREFLLKMQEMGVPVVIMSASGLGDAIPLFMEHENLSLRNIHYAINRMVWDTLGSAVDFKQPIIHSLNKDETSLKDFPEIFEKIAHKTRILLLGNSVGDAKMADGFANEALLKIAFLDKEDPTFEQKYEKFKENFDLIITDGSFTSLL